MWSGSIRTGVVIAALGVSGCADDSGGGSSGDDLELDAARDFEGIFEITTWTENADGCDGEGDDRLAMANEPYVALVANEVFGLVVLEAMSCVDVADCEAKAQAFRDEELTASEYRTSMSEQLGPDELSGFTAWTGFSKDGICESREYEEHSLVLDGDALTVTTRVFALEDRPEEDGFCVAEPLEMKNEAMGAPCVGATDLSATRAADLPPE